MLTAALTHFLSQPDSIFGPREGVVVIRATPAKNGWLTNAAEIEADFRSAGVDAPHEAFLDYLKNAAHPGTLPPLGDVGLMVRRDDRFTDVVAASEALGQHVPSIISPQRPGYDRTGHVAIVAFEFTWSMTHGGRALYELRRAPSGAWSVSGNDIQIYL